MLLACDIGNSAIKCGIFEGARLHQTLSLPHDATGLGVSLASLLKEHRVSRAGIASVVPRSRQMLEAFLQERGISVTTIGPAMPLPFRIDYKTPETLGTDRIAAAAAAWVLHGQESGGGLRSVIALDAGTAVTCEVVRRDGVYLGGTIGPGPVLMQRALNRETAQLPEIPLEAPENAIGASTVEAMQAGVIFGFIDSVRGLLERINVALEEEAYVVATGGWGELLQRHVKEIVSFDPSLVLRGVRVLVEGDW